LFINWDQARISPIRRRNIGDSNARKLVKFQLTPMPDMMIST
jgi:hypothetical protein